MASELRIQVDSTADTKGIDRTADALDDLADQADATKKSTKGLGDEVDKTTKKTEGLGQTSKRTSEDVRTLDGRIAQLKSNLRGLSADLQKDVGDKSLLKKFRKDSSELAGLEQMRKQMSGLTDDTGRFAKALSNVGGTFSQVFQGGLINFLKTPFGATAAGVVGSGVAINAGALAGGAISAGAGIGVAGAGVAGAAMQSKAVQDEWAGVTADIKKQFLDATTSFEKPTIEAVERIGGAVRDLHMDKIFGDAVKFVEPLSVAAAKTVGSVGRGVEALVSKGEPAIRATADAVVKIGDGVENALETIAGGGEGGAEAIRDLGSALSEVTQDIGYFVRGTEEAYGGLESFRRKAAEVHPFIGMMYDIKGTDNVHVLSEPLDNAAQAAKRAEEAAKHFGQAGYDSFRGIDQKARETLDTIERINRAWDDALGKTLDLSNANIAVAADFANVRKEFEGGAHALDVNYEKGRNNLQLINDTVADLGRQRDAAIAAGGGTEEAYNKARGAYNSQIAALEAMLVKLGLSKQAAHDLMAQFYDKTVTVTVKVHQVGDVTKEGVILSGDMRRSAGQAYASGTPSARAGWAIVGDRGPELVNFGGGEQVKTAGETSRMLAGTSSSGAGGWSAGGATRIELVPAPRSGDALMDEFIRMLRARVRNEAGGDVTEFFASAV